MKIKHWQGYGCVNAKKIHADRNLLTIEVKGEHECGLDRSDYVYDVFDWLVKRFDKTRSNYDEIKKVDFEYCENDRAIYRIHFKNKT